MTDYARFLYQAIGPFRQVSPLQYIANTERRSGSVGIADRQHRAEPVHSAIRSSRVPQMPPGSISRISSGRRAAAREKPGRRGRRAGNRTGGRGSSCRAASDESSAGAGRGGEAGATRQGQAARSPAETKRTAPPTSIKKGSMVATQPTLPARMVDRQPPTMPSSTEGASAMIASAGRIGCPRQCRMPIHVSRSRPRPRNWRIQSKVWVRGSMQAQASAACAVSDARSAGAPSHQDETAVRHDAGSLLCRT